MTSPSSPLVALVTPMVSKLTTQTLLMFSKGVSEKSVLFCICSLIVTMNYNFDKISYISIYILVQVQHAEVIDARKLPAMPNVVRMKRKTRMV